MSNNAEFDALARELRALREEVISFIPFFTF